MANEMETLLTNAQVLDVRIFNKIDTYEQWMLSTKVLGDGEIAIARMESAPEGQTKHDGMTPPAVGIRVGDGVHTFAELPWLQATAGDVYAWAKAADKPSYVADEIGGLETYISQKVQDTNTTYEFAYANDTLTVTKFEIGEKEAGGEGEVVATLPIDVSTKINKVAGAKEGEVAVFTADGALKTTGQALTGLATVAYVDGKFAVDSEVSESLGEINQAITALDGRVGVNEGAITALQTKDGELQAAIDLKVAKVAGTKGNVVVFGENGTIADGGSLSVYETVENAAKTYETIDNVAAKVKEINDAAAALAGRVDTAESEIDALQGAVGTLTGTGEGSVKATVDAAINKFATDITDNGVVDSFKELVDYVVENDAAVDQIVKDINTNKQNIEGLAADSHKHAGNLAILDTIDQARVDVWDAAVQSISGVEATKTGTDIKVTAVSTDLLKQGSKTIVFRCGSASAVF